MRAEQEERPSPSGRPTSHVECELACTTGSRLVLKDASGEAWARQPCVMGIDEAGRGSVMGPMSEDLKGRAFNDSKQLTEQKRDNLFATINGDGRIGYIAEVLSAHFISTSMLSKDRVSLNQIATNSTIKIIQTVLDAGVRITQVFIDTVGDAERYENLLSRRFPTLRFTVCPKADALYPSVSGASIVAKVVRDRALVETCKMLNITTNPGSGYPGDDITKAFLKGHLHPVWGFPMLVRHSWETCTRLLDAEGAAKVEFEVDAQEADASQQKISFGSKNPNSTAMETTAVGRHSYFRVRKLQRMVQAF